MRELSKVDLMCSVYGDTALTETYSEFWISFITANTIWVSSVETDFSSRVSRLVDRVSSILLSDSPDTSSDVAQSLAEMERTLDDMRAELDQMNVSKTVSAESGHREEPVSCERAMGFDRSQVYPPYIILNQTPIDRQILCNTQTDGGG
ncbi:hypothetical protein RRG08_046669 [Elysia crispata]|uniref:Uncharacterized protein n=1 Tax=Elysia crispata TaxID=231223 RepID=A0AAE1DQ70_9GAST|nr:hypothetical protein RRG08_046669 [Elysia crispata]